MEHGMMIAEVNMAIGATDRIPPLLIPRGMDEEGWLFSE
jgi:hypothetical protein